MRLFLFLALFAFAGPLFAEDEPDPPVETKKDFLVWGFFKRHQSPDGSWNPVTYAANCTEKGPKCEPGQGGPDDVVAVTAQAALCFMGMGCDHKTPSKYKQVTAKALTWLLAQEKADGRIGGTVEAQALATVTLCEAYAMTNDATLKEPAQRAVNRLLALRLLGADRKPLAWGDPKTGLFDTAMTNGALMAMKSAQSGGFDVGDVKERGNVWWDAAWKAANPGWEKLTVSDMSTFPARWSAKDGAQGEDISAGACAAAWIARRKGDIDGSSLVNTLLAKRLPTGKHSPPICAPYIGAPSPSSITVLVMWPNGRNG